MNILMVTMSFGIGGAETYILELSKELMRRGHSVTVASSGGVYAEQLEQAGAVHVTLPLSERSPIKLARAYKGLKKLIKDHIQSGEPFDIVHAHARLCTIVCGKLKRSMPGEFHYVTTAHGVYKMLPGLSALTDWGERSLAVSEDVKKYLIGSYGISPDNITLTVNGIDAERFCPAQPDRRTEAVKKLGLSSECKHRVMHVSRLDSASSDAAVQLIIGAERLAELYPDIEIVTVGAGTEFDRLSAEAEQVNEKIGRKVLYMLGSRSDIPDILTCADIFVGVSRAALEAMSCGIPTVLAGAQGYLGIFDGEDSLRAAQKTNFCCRDGEKSSTDKLISDIKKLFDSDPEKLSGLGVFGREMVKRFYSVFRMGDDAEKMYRDCMK